MMGVRSFNKLFASAAATVPRIHRGISGTGNSALPGDGLKSVLTKPRAGAKKRGDLELLSELLQYHPGMVVKLKLDVPQQKRFLGDKAFEPRNKFSPGHHGHEKEAASHGISKAHELYGFPEHGRMTGEWTTR